MRPRALNLLENPAVVQWVHRVLGTLLLVASLAVFARHRARISGIFAALVTVQYGLGVATLLQRVPVALGVRSPGDGGPDRGLLARLAPDEHHRQGSGAVGLAGRMRG